MIAGPELLRRLEAGKLVPAPVYLLAGDDAWMRDELIARLGAVPAAGSAWAAANRTTCWAGETSEAEAVELARTPPFGSPRRVVVVRDAGGWFGKAAGPARRPRKAGGAAAGGPLLGYLADPAPTTTLILSWEGGRAGAEAVAAAAAKAGEVVECDRPADAALSVWATRQAQLLGLAASPEALAAVLARAGEEPLAVRRELEKLAAYAGGAPAELEEALAVAGEAAPPHVFDFLDALFVDRRAGPVLSQLGRLLADMHPLQLLALISSQLRKLAILRSVLAAGAGTWQAAGKVRLPPALVERLGLVLRRTSAARLAELLRAAGAAEAALKSGGDGRTVLEGFVLEACRRVTA